MSCLDVYLPPCDLATCVIHIVAIIMTGIMIFHIRSKYTAVGMSFRQPLNWRFCSDLNVIDYRTKRNPHVLLSLRDYRAACNFP